MKRAYTLHKERCQSKLRKSHTKKNGDVISLFGKHGFEWSIGITKNDNTVFLAITTFPNRELAMKEYVKLCK